MSNPKIVRRITRQWIARNLMNFARLADSDYCIKDGKMERWSWTLGGIWVSIRSGVSPQKAAEIHMYVRWARGGLGGLGGFFSGEVSGLGGQRPSTLSYIDARLPL